MFFGLKKSQKVPGLLAGVGLSIFLHLSQPGASPSVPRRERSKAIILPREQQLSDRWNAH
jgi:hypothetical protein